MDKETREKMRRFSHINWSETIRRAIERTIEEEEMKDRNIDYEEVSEAAEMVDTIRNRLRPSPGWNSTEEIRKWRDGRGR